MSRTELPPPTQKCECEHDAHFQTPPAHHPYGELCVHTRKVKTPFSTLNVCQFCYDNCLFRYTLSNPR